MYLRRSKRFTVACGILAAVFLALGIWLIQYGLIRQEAIHETEWPVTKPLQNTSEEEISFSVEELENGALPSAMDRNKESGVPGKLGLGTGRIKTWLGTASIIIGLTLSVVFVFFCRQEKPIFGLDGSMAVLLLFGLLYLVVFSSVLNVYSVVMGNALFQFENLSRFFLNGLCILLVLMVLREFMAWVWNRCPLSWMLAHRISKFWMGISGRKSVFLFCWTGLGLAVIFLYGLTTRWMNEYETIYQVVRFVQVAQGCIIFIGLVRFFRELDHLTGQVAALSEEREVTVGKGVFQEEEEQLQELSRKTEAAIQAAVTSERFKVDLISNVSHDLRTPLTAILGYGELLKKEKLTEIGEKQLHALNQKASYMSDLVESLFELTKVSSGVLECKKENIDLIRLLEQTLGLYDEELQHHQLVVRRHYEKETLFLMTDGNRMYQVFANLLGNAIKYTLSGTRIHLEVKEREEQVEIRLVNIASYEMDFDSEEILQRFARGDKARSSKGSGLGLSIAQTYTESVGGKFSVAIDGEQFSAIVKLPKN